MNTKSSIGVLLLNLGTPDDPSVPAVRRYLREFLSDPRVVDLPAVARWVLLNLFILPFRPRRSAAAYQKIWTEHGSPLMVNSELLRGAVKNTLGSNYHVALGMRYGSPSIESAIEALKKQCCEYLIVLPLFPQYSSAATGSVLEKTMEVIRNHWNIPKLILCNDFYDHPGFIAAQAIAIQEHLADFRPDHIIFSYHGLPEHHITKSECAAHTCTRREACPGVENHNRYCYRAQCFATSNLLAKALNLSSDQFSVSFQSRLGRTPWIKPYTDFVLPELVERNFNNIAVVCPSFAADCLETLEEMGIRAREQWQRLGGKRFELIPCLNAHPKWVKVVAEMIGELTLNSC